MVKEPIAVWLSGIPAGFGLFPAVDDLQNAFLRWLLKENSLVLKHSAQCMLNVIYAHLGGSAVEGFRKLRVVFR